MELKLATEKDYDCFYDIRAEKHNLFWTGYDSAPNYGSFKIWYSDRLKEKNRDIYLLWLEDKCCGALNIDQYEDYVFIGYSIKSTVQGKGLASFMVSKVDSLLPLKHKFKEIRAWINFSNIASIKVCEKNGFVKSDTSEIRKRFGNEELYYLMVKPL